MTRRLGSLAALVSLATVAACGGTATTIAPAATPAPATPVTPTAPVATETPGPDDGSIPADEPVDLVVLAYSGGWGVAERYGPLVADALGREVRNHGRLGTLPTDVLSGAEGGADVVAGAEVILFYFPPGGYEPSGFLPCLAALEAEDGDQVDPPEVTTVEDWQAWRDALDREYEAIWTLREGQPTIIRGYGNWNSWIPVWRQAGVEAECTAGEEAYDQVMREAAEAHGATYVSMLDVFTGPQHDQDPAEQGWIADDGMHLSDPGKDVLVDALAAAGFELNEPPG